VDSDLKRNLLIKAKWAWRETLRMHKLSPETRVASSLSLVEILVTLYYGGILSFNAKDQYWEGRDRLIISKGHGSITLYPILADMEYFSADLLNDICKSGSFLGAIPDPVIPGYETVNGSLGHGLGVATGVALALKKKKSTSSVFVIVGDGELYEGANWEAIMFAPQHCLDNLILIIDCNKVSMLDFTENIISHLSLAKKFEAFGWNVTTVNGHDIEEVYLVLNGVKQKKMEKPTVIIANTIKGHGVEFLEKSHLSHVLSISAEKIDQLLQ